MERVIQEHEVEYGEKPQVIACAPGRFHLMGEHTWFFRDKTLSCAVNLPVYVAVSKRNDTNLRFNFVQLNEKKRSSLVSMKLKKEDKWANSIKAILFGLQALNNNLDGMNFTIYSEILPSAGFGITTAMKVATLTAVKELFSINLKPEQDLLVLEKANRLFLQTENLKADNFAALYSKENHMILTDYNAGQYDLIPFNFENRTIILTDSRVPRVVTWNEVSLQQPENVLLLGELKARKSNVYGGWAYEENRAEINEVLSVVNEDTKRRLICVMQEHKNIIDVVNAIRKNDFATFAKAVKRSHENMRDLYDVSCPEIDWILKRVQELDKNPDDLRNPVNCGRITGKGFGRSTYTIIRDCDLEEFNSKLVEYERIFGFKSESYVVKPANGVHLV